MKSNKGRGPPEEKETPSILYHGACYEDVMYHLVKYGFYSGFNKNDINYVLKGKSVVELTEKIDAVLDRGREHSKEFNGLPSILVIPTPIIDKYIFPVDPIRIHGIEYIMEGKFEIGDFLICKIGSKYNSFNEKDYYKKLLKLYTNLVQETGKDTIKEIVNTEIHDVKNGFLKDIKKYEELMFNKEYL